MNKEFEIKFCELFNTNSNKNEIKIELKNEKLIRIVAVKNDEKFPIQSNENVKIRAVVYAQK